MTDDKIKELIDSEKPINIRTIDYDIDLNVQFKTDIELTIKKATKDKHGKSIAFSDKDLQKLIEDLQDLADWRNYKRLKNKLNE